MLKTLLISFFIITNISIGWSINKAEVDSLKQLIKTETIDTSIYNYCYSIGVKYIKIDPDTSLKYINIGLDAIDKNNNAAKYYKGLNLKAACFWFNNRLDSSISVYYKALAVAKMIGDENDVAKISNNLGVTYQYLANIDSAEKYLSQACHIYKQTNNAKAYAKASLDLGALYTSEGKYDVAIEKLLNGLQTFEEIEDTLYLIHGYNGIGNLYVNIDDGYLALSYYRKALHLTSCFEKGDISDELYCNMGLAYFQTLNNYDSAEYYFQKALSKENIENNHLLYSSVLVNLGTLKNTQHKYQEALEYFLTVKNMESSDSDPYSKMVCYVNLGNTYLEIGELNNAESHLLEGLEKAKELNSLEFQKNTYHYLSKVDSLRGNYLGALKYYEKFNSISMQIHNTEMEEKLHVINSKNQLKHIQAENIALEKQNKLKLDLINKHKKLNILIGILLILTIAILSITFILYQKSRKLNSKLKGKNKKILKQKEELQTLNNQLNKLISIIAHDLKAPFNALIGLLNELDTNSDQYSEEEKNAIIKGLLENTKSTYNLLENLMEWSISKTGLLRMNLEVVNIAQLTDEVLQLNHIQLSNKLINVDNNLSPHAEVYADRKMTFTILTNLINNAIKFNNQGGIISIEAKILNNYLRVCVKDNGIGIPKKYINNIFSIDSEYQTRGTENEYGTGLGLKVVAEFISRMNGKVMVKSEEGNGAKFYFELPIKKTID